MKIYTATGDKGFTSLIGGKRVPKYHKRIEAYGAVDELISYIGLLRDLIEIETIKNDLLTIQDKLMICAAQMACEKNSNDIPNLHQTDYVGIEKQIDSMNLELKVLTHFILPGGHPIVSHCQIARTICRRAERQMIKSIKHDDSNNNIFVYINRLSDYLFTLARFIAKKEGVNEIFWIRE